VGVGSESLDASGGAPKTFCRWPFAMIAQSLRRTARVSAVHSSPGEMALTLVQLADGGWKWGIKGARLELLFCF
jgi:hypothetical protein